MNVVSIVIFVLLAAFCTWLIVDTIIYIVKRVKQKKAKNEQVEHVDDTTNK